MAISFSVFIDPSYTAEQRRVIGRRIVDYVVNRTQAGLGVGRKPFTNRQGKKEYSKAYQEHRDFEIGGKSKKPINLTLTGDMLNTLDVLDITLPGRIIIGIEDDQNAEKAQWMREKGYNFLGLSQEEQNQILAKFSKLTPVEIAASNLAADIADEFLRNLFDGES